MGSIDWYSGMDAFNIICGIVTLASFILAVWLWLKNKTQTHELMSRLSNIHAMTLSTIVEVHQTIGAGRGHVVQRALGCLSSIRELTHGYALSEKAQIDAAHLPLVELGILWPKSMIWEIELAKETREIWLYTPDLRPDSTDTAVGESVMENLRAAKNYVYFFPEDLQHRDEEVAKLMKNVGAADHDAWKDRIKFVPIRNPSTLGLANDNTLFLFRDSARLLQPRCFEEIRFTKVASRGAYWQEHSETKARELQHALADALAEQGA